MKHLSSEEILGYLDGDKSIVDLKKASKHLDKCDKCTSKLKDFAAISILFELTIAQANEQREKEILGKCPDTDTIFGLIENRLSSDDKEKIEAHLKECEFCQKALELIRVTEEIPKAKAPEIREPERILPTILRNFELYFVACEREKVIRKEKEFRIPGLETIRKMILPRQPVLIPLGFAELVRRDKKFYCELDDKQLMQACKEFDNMAWFELERRFRNYAYTVIRAYGLKEDWEDIWQVALRALAKLIKKYEERGKARYFIKKIIIFKCLIWRKRVKKEEKILKCTYNQTKQRLKASGPRDQLIEKKAVKHFIENIKKMPKKFSSVLMALIDGLNDREIAHVLNMRVETVRTRKLRARIRLFEMKKKEPEVFSKIKRFEWVKRKFYKFFTPQ